MVIVENSKNKNVLSFTRENAEDRVFVVLNLSASDLDVELKGDQFMGEYENIFSNERISFSESSTLQLEPWAYRVFVK